MAIDSFAVVRAVTPTSITTQDITSSLIAQDTTTPRFALIIASGATADDSPVAHARIAVGFVSWDGTTIRQFSVGHRSTSGIASPSNRTCSTSANALVIPHESTAAATNRGLATATAIAGGIRLSYSAAPDVAYKLTVLLCSGSALQAFVGVASATTTPSSEAGVGFEADFVLTQAVSGSVGAAVSYGNDAVPGLGAAVNGASLDQAGVFEGWELTGDPVGTSDADGTAETDRSAGLFNANVAELVSITAFDGDGWTHVADAGSPTYVYLAVKLGDTRRRIGVKIEALPAGPGVSTFTQLGLPVEVGILGANLLTASDTPTDGATASTFTLGIFGPSGEGCAGMAQDENQATGGANTATGSNADARALHVMDEVGASAVEASFDGTRVPSGFALNFATATVGRMVAFGIGFAPGSLPFREIARQRAKAIQRQRQRRAFIQTKAPAGAPLPPSFWREVARQRRMAQARLRWRPFVSTVVYVGLPYDDERAGRVLVPGAEHGRVLQIEHSDTQVSVGRVLTAGASAGRVDGPGVMSQDPTNP